MCEISGCPYKGEACGSCRMLRNDLEEAYGLDYDPVIQAAAQADLHVVLTVDELQDLFGGGLTEDDIKELAKEFYVEGYEDEYDEEDDW